MQVSGAAQAPDFSAASRPDVVQLRPLDRSREGNGNLFSCILISSPVPYHVKSLILYTCVGEEKTAFVDMIEANNIFPR